MLDEWSYTYDSLLVVFNLYLLKTLSLDSHPNRIKNKNFPHGPDFGAINSIFRNCDLDLWPTEPKIKSDLALPNSFHLYKFCSNRARDTQVIIRKRHIRDGIFCPLSTPFTWKTVKDGKKSLGRVLLHFSRGSICKKTPSKSDETPPPKTPVTPIILKTVRDTKNPLAYVWKHSLRGIQWKKSYRNRIKN